MRVSSFSIGESTAVPSAGIVEVSAYHYNGSDEKLYAQSQRVVVEQALTLDIRNTATYNLMWTPTEPLPAELGYIAGEGMLGAEAVPEIFALAAGFCYSEGIISSMDQLLTLAYCDRAAAVVRIELAGVDPDKLHRKNVLVTSSCGLCTQVDLVDDNFFELRAVDNTLCVRPRTVLDHAATMHTQQRVFPQTGGTHAALLFDQQGALHSCEDLGRHNAMDKVLGHALMNNQTSQGSGVMISSRVSTELVMKAVRAGVEVLAGIGAPTSTALKLAQRFNLTLCGFVRNNRLTVFTHPKRMTTSPT